MRAGSAQRDPAQAGTIGDVGELHVDLTRHPLATLAQYELLDDSEFERLFQVLDELVARAEPFALLYIADYEGSASAERTLRQAQWIKANRDALRSHCVGFGLVFSSPVIRFMLSGMSLIQPFPIPQRTFAEAALAEHWLIEQLRRRGLPVPPPAIRASG